MAYVGTDTYYTCSGEEALTANLQVLVSNTILRETIPVAREEVRGEIDEKRSREDVKSGKKRADRCEPAMRLEEKQE